MNKNVYGYQFFFLFAVLLSSISCSKSKAIEQQEYIVIAYDSISMPIEGLEIIIGHHIGGTYSLGTGVGYTDASGKAEITTDVDLDTVQAILDREGWSEQFYYQSIGVSDESYLRYQIFQNGIDKTQARRKLDPEGEITLHCLKRAILQVAYTDDSNLGDITYIEFEIVGQNGDVQIKDEFTPHINQFVSPLGIYIPGNAALTINWELYTGEYLNGTLVKSGSSPISVKENKVKTFTISR